MSEYRSEIEANDSMLLPAWMTPSPHCNQNCRQGRGCDCEEAVPDSQPSRASWRAADLVIALILVACIAAYSAGAFG